MKDNELTRIVEEVVSKFTNPSLPDYSNIVKAASYDNPLTIAMTDRKFLEEGLVRTYPIEKTVDYIKSYYSIEDDQILIVDSENGLKHIKVRVPITPSNVEKIKKSMDFFGYYLSAPREDRLIPGTWSWLQFEPKFQDTPVDIRGEEKVLYHITPKYNEGKITHIGFSPRSKNVLFDFPNRVYFMRGSCGKLKILGLADQLRRVNPSEGNDGRYCLFTINLDKVPQDVVFYADPNYRYGVYTTSNIPPEAIVSVIDLDFD